MTKSKFSWTTVDTFLAQRDALSALLVWLVGEGMSLFLLPHFRLLPDSYRTQTWVLVSTLLGIMGAMLIGLSSTFIQYCQDHLPKYQTNKQFLILIGQVGGWLGLVGIGFPMIVIGLELWLMILHGPAHAPQSY